MEISVPDRVELLGFNIATSDWCYKSKHCFAVVPLIVINKVSQGGFNIKL